MGVRASLALGPRRLPPCWPKGLLLFGVIQASSALRVGASFALEPPRPHPHGRGGLLCFRIIKAPATLAWGPVSLWHHQGAPRKGVGTSFVFGSLRPPPA